VSLLVGGNESAGSINYIIKYGFYQGGLDNPYRLDPRKIIAVLSGKRFPALVDLEIEIATLETAKVKKFLIEVNQEISNLVHIESLESREKKEHFLKSEKDDLNAKLRSAEDTLHTLQEEKEAFPSEGPHSCCLM